MQTIIPDRVEGLLRKQVEVMSEATLGISGVWTWQPNKKIDMEKLANVSPTQEYSTENGEN